MSVHAESAERTGRSGTRKAERGDDQAAAVAGLDLLRAVGWLVLHDVAVPGDVEVPIDHVLAGPSGVYVINTISAAGTIRMTDTSLLVGGVSAHDHIEDIAAAALALREELDGRPVVPILCFARCDEVAGVVAKVAVCSTENILELLNGQPKVLDAVAANEVMRKLRDTVERQSEARRVRPVAVVAEPEVKPRHREKARGRKRLLGFGRSGGEEDAAPVELSVVASLVEPVVEPVVEVPEVDEARLEAERLAAEEAALAEAERVEVEQAARVEAERVAAEEAARAEADRVAAEEAARAEAERLAAEEAARAEAERVEAERLAAEEAARAEAERLAVEEAIRVAAEEEAARAEAERVEAERVAAEEAARLAAEEAARVEAERLAAEEAARVEAERLAAEEAARVEAERLAAEEAERVEAERLAAEEAARAEAERVAAEEAARIAAEEAARVEAERLAAEEAARVEAERLAAEEAARVEAERLAAEEAERVEAERLAAEEAAAKAEVARLAAEKAAWLEAQALARAEAERIAAEEAARSEVERPRPTPARVKRPVELVVEPVVELEEEYVEEEYVADDYAEYDYAEDDYFEDESFEDESFETIAAQPPLEPVVEPPARPVVRQTRGREDVDERPSSPPVGPAARRIDVRSAVKMVSAAFARRDEQPEFDLEELETAFQAETAEPEVPAWFGGPKPSPAKPAAEPVAEEPAKKRRVSLMPAVVGAVVVAVIFGIAPRVPDAYDWGKSFFVEPPPPSLGESAVIAQTGSHPTVQVMAGIALNVKSANGVTAAKGQHLVGVPVTLMNQGDVKWTLKIASAFKAVDTIGVPHSPAAKVTKVTAGKVLPKRLQLVPGKTVTGMVVFAVGNGRDIGRVEVTLANGEVAAIWNAKTD